MAETIRLSMGPDGAAFDFGAGYARLSDELDALGERYDAEQLKPARYVSALREFVARNPHVIAAYADLGQALLEQDKPRQALEAAQRGVQIGEKVIPADYRGPIEWRIPANQSFLAAADIVARAHVALAEAREATQAMEKLLAWNPRDEQGVGLRIGALYLRCGEKEKARAALDEAVDHFPPALYDLALLHIVESDFLAAATALRRAFAATPYVAELLCGAVTLEPLSSSESDPRDDIEDALDYVDANFEIWTKTAQAIPFLRWLYHHPRAMAERAAIFDLREQRLWEKSLDARDRLEASEEKLTERIDDALSAELVRQRETRDGRHIMPWLYWPAQDEREGRGARA